MKFVCATCAKKVHRVGAKQPEAKKAPAAKLTTVHARGSSRFRLFPHPQLALFAALRSTTELLWQFYPHGHIRTCPPGVLQWNRRGWGTLSTKRAPAWPFGAWSAAPHHASLAGTIMAYVSMAGTHQAMPDQSAPRSQEDEEEERKGAGFLLLDASDRAITLCWKREPDVSVECVQMRTYTVSPPLRGKQQQGGEDEGAAAAAAGSKQHVEEVAPSSGGGGVGGVAGCGGGPEADAEVDAKAGAGAEADGDEREWVTLSETLGSSALKKNKLAPGTAYVFRRRARKQEEEEEWGRWSQASDPFRTLPEGAKQPTAPAVKLRESGALVMEWGAVAGASAYEVQMSVSGGEWATIAGCFGSTLLRKKGLDKSEQYRFRFRPVFGVRSAEVAEEGGEWGWSPASALASPAVLNAFLSSQVPAKLVGKEKSSVSRDVLAGKVVAFYFSASWCGPCRAYTPKLAALYSRAKAQHKAFEVVFVSLDGDEESMHRYHAGMPWLAVPYDEPFREDFAASKGVNSVPRLVVTGRRGQELASNAVGMTWEQLVAWEAQG